MIDHLLETTKYLGLFISLGAFMIGLKLNKKYPYAFMNPLLIGTILVMGLILVLDVEVAVFQKSAQVLSDLLTPATICLAVPVYRQFKILRENSWVVLISCLAGMISGLVTIIGLALILQDERNHDTIHLGALDHDGHRVGYDRTDRRCRRDHSGRGHLRGHFWNGGFRADFQNLQDRRTDRERVGFGCGFPRHGDS